MRRSLTFAALALALAVPQASAHPHFNKTITATIDGVDFTIKYNTTPANEMRADQTPKGVFTTPRGPRLTLSADLKAADTVVLAAGEYTIGVIKNDADWTLALYPGTIARGAQPDAAKVMKMDSMFETAAGDADHMLIDLTPGHGKFEGKAVLTIHFGKLFLAGRLN